LFPFYENVFVPGESPLNVYSEILLLSGELHIVDMNQWARLFSCCECDVDQLASVSFHSPFLIPVLVCK
jgi:hypothetical protein